MKVLRLAAAVLFCLVTFTGFVEAAPITMTLTSTSPLYNEDPPGAPLPLGRTQYDSGDIMFNGQKIGEYLRVKNVHAGGMNVAATTISLFFPGRTAVPFVLTLEGVHSFDSGGETGSICASDIAGLVGVRFTANTATDTLTLHLP